MSLGRLLRRGRLSIRRALPTITLIFGAGSVVAGTVVACKQTRKLDGVMIDMESQLDYIRERKEQADASEIEYYDDKNYRRDIAGVYKDTAVDLVKLYWLAVLLQGGGLGLIGYSHHMMKMRNLALASSYAALGSSFSAYRKRVADRYGKDVEDSILHGYKTEEVRGLISEDPPVIAKQPAKVTDGEVDGACYAREFSQGTSTQWSCDYDLNESFIISQERVANQQLARNGYLFLNDVYQLLGFQPTVAGQCVGWIYDGNGDGKVDLRLKSMCRRITGYSGIIGVERYHLIDPNVDGPILESGVFEKY